MSYPAKIKDEEGHVYTIRYPEPYFKTVGDKAVAVYGNYIDELFKKTKDGVLTARGLFGNGDAYDIEIINTQMAELGLPEIISPSDSVLLSKTWEGVMTAVKKKNFKSFRKFSLDSIYCDVEAEVEYQLPRRKKKFGGIFSVQKFIEGGVDSLKNEGLIKNETVSTYRNLMSAYREKTPYAFRFSHRDSTVIYTVGFARVTESREVFNYSFFNQALPFLFLIFCLSANF